MAKEDVDEKVLWTTTVLQKTAEFNAAVTEMASWLSEIEEIVKGLGPVSSDMELTKEQMKIVEVRKWIFCLQLCRQWRHYSTGLPFYNSLCEALEMI